MCVIAISPKGRRQPSDQELYKMWCRNPDGAGYMFVSDRSVIIKKGFMSFDSFINSVNAEHFTDNIPVVYHFRIATQANRKEMTQPFPISKYLPELEELQNVCNYGIAHNGIIDITTSRNENRYSDTALFITKYLSKIIRCRKDIYNYDVQEMIVLLAQYYNKFAIMDCSGSITTIGRFTEYNGIILSNTHHITNWRV